MKHRTIRGCLFGAVIALSLLASGGVAAHAADTSSGTQGLPSGTQAATTINTATGLWAIPPAATPPAVNPPSAATPVFARPDAEITAAQPLAVTAGANGGLLVVGVLLLAFGGLLALILGRKRS
ncbi:hypothetical protein [Arthrobacter sp. Soil764]|uniref:hypothetical protein n=1 Tax=Arthrobacter sp. Soil764 TaxID=1736403 RepID=UPI0006FEA9AF|nr:hypothetical protein [Arthrobacter sp. Soil764]KRE91203.1 hypothetical protein ASG86_15675 [Arthrobacter sp. Soil764]